MKNLSKLAPFVLAALFTVGCEQKGPAEKAGEALDNATTDVGNAIEDACEDVKDSVGAKDKDC